MTDFFAPRESSRQPNATSTSRRGTPQTTAAIVVTPDYQVVVWANQPRYRQSLEDPWRNTLVYYAFLDDRRFTHLDALLTQLAPMSVLHLVCTEKIGSASSSSSSSSRHTTMASRQKAKQAMDLVKTLEKVIATRTDLTAHDDDINSNAAAAPASLSHVHTEFPTIDKKRIDDCMAQLLLESSELSFRGNVQISSHPWIHKALGFWLHTEGFVQSAVPDDMIGRFHVQAGAMNSHLLLDRTAASCIHLLPPPNAGVATVVGGRPHNNSLLGILSQPSMTKMGKRLMEHWLRQPLIDLQAILHRQGAVQELVENGVGRDQLREEGLRNFSGMDIAKLAVQLGVYQAVEENADDEDCNNNNNNNNATPTGSTQKALQSLYQLYLLTAQKVPLLLDSLQNVVCTDGDASTIPTDEADQSLLQSIFVGLQKVHNELARSQDLAETVLDLEVAPREFLIKASFKDELKDIKTELGNVEAAIEECHDEINQLWAETNGLNLDSNHVRLETFGETDSTKMWQFRLPNANDAKALLDGPLADRVTVHRLLKNGVYFSTKKLRELSTNKQELIAEYDRHQKQVVQDAMKVAATYQGPLERTNELVAQLDVLVSLAHVAAYSPHGYCRPTITDVEENGMIRLKDARHPLVELVEPQDNVDFIPNDFNLVFGESSFLLLTGPNMGGKSTYIRALGAIVTMAQIGSYVPCSSATINICHHILARVGAGDLQDRGISTFMAEMLEASSILKTATKRSLIVIDELGRGTSTFDGYGLARAISEYIVQRIGCFSVFATHFHELTALEDQERSVKNYHVTAQKGRDGLTFLYEVKPGPCLESFGIHVAEMAKLPAVVIVEAKRKALELENFDYKKKRRIEEENVDGQHTAEEKSAALDFMSRFRRLPLKSMASNDEKLAALRKLLTEGL